MIDIKRIVEEKNSKRIVLGKNELYRILNSGDIGILLNNVDIANFKIPDFVTTILNEGKGNDIIETLEFDDNITTINIGSFENFTKLKEISDLTNIINLDCENLFYGCKSMIKSPRLPININNLDSTFKECINLLESPEIPDGVISMNETFYGCISLNEAPFIPDNVEFMSKTFYNCYSMKKAINIPENVKDMRYTLNNCFELEGSLNIDAEPEIYYGCLRDASINGKIKLYISGKSRKLNEIIDTKSDLSNIFIKEVMTYNEKLIQDKNTKRRMLGKNDLYYIRNGNIYIDLDQVDSPRIVIPDFVYGIFNESTDGNTKIERIEFGDNIKEIEKLAFNKLTNLKFISNLDKVDIISDDNFDYLFLGCKSLIKAPKLPNGIKSIEGIFYGCESITEAPEIPNTVINMQRSFCECSSLIDTPTIPESVRDLKKAFAFCTSLKNPSTIPINVKDMTEAFRCCYSLKGEMIINTKRCAFYECFKFASSKSETKLIIKSANTDLNHTIINACSNIEIIIENEEIYSKLSKIKKLIKWGGE